MKTLFALLAAMFSVSLSACSNDASLPSCKEVTEKCILDKAMQLPPTQAGMQQAEQICNAQKVACRK
jgi:hypothetical protein